MLANVARNRALKLIFLAALHELRTLAERLAVVVVEQDLPDWLREQARDLLRAVRLREIAALRELAGLD